MFNFERGISVAIADEPCLSANRGTNLPPMYSNEAGRFLLETTGYTCLDDSTNESTFHPVNNSTDCAPYNALLRWPDCEPGCCPNPTE